MRSAITITSFLMISMTVPASQTPAQKQKIEVATIKPSIPSPVVRIGGSCHGTDSAYYLRHRATTIGTMCLCQHHSGRLVVQYLRSPGFKWNPHKSDWRSVVGGFGTLGDPRKNRKSV